MAGMVESCHPNMGALVSKLAPMVGPQFNARQVGILIEARDFR
jgi:hypothetical protein